MRELSPALAGSAATKRRAPMTGVSVDVRSIRGREQALVAVMPTLRPWTWRSPAWQQRLTSVRRPGRSLGRGPLAKASRPPARVHRHAAAIRVARSPSSFTASRWCTGPTILTSPAPARRQVHRPRRMFTAWGVLSPPPRSGLGDANRGTHTGEGTAAGAGNRWRRSASLCSSPARSA